MEVLGNTASVRKYYRSHRNDIIKQKTLHACKQEGRIPRLSTIQKHQMQWNDVLQAYLQNGKQADQRMMATERSVNHACVP